MMYVPDYKDVVKIASDGTELAVRGSKWWLVSEISPKKVSKPVRAKVAGCVSRAIEAAKRQGGAE